MSNGTPYPHYSMKYLTTYQQHRNALNDILNFLGTDEFLELPEPERRVCLQKLTELVKAATQHADDNEVQFID